MCDGRPPRLTAFPPTGESRRFFLRLPSSMGSVRCSLFDSQSQRARRNTLLQEDSLYECGRPCDALSCFFFSALWASEQPIHIGAGDSVSEGY